MRLNADVGEGFGAWSMGLDAEIMAWIDQASIACGFHASDPMIMTRTVRLALEHQVQIGAHPAYPDLQGFGRRSMQLAPAEVIALLRYQIGALDAIVQAEGGVLSYVKPHGALYNDMMAQPQLLAAVMESISALNQFRSTPLALMLLSRSDNQNSLALARQHQLPLLFEAFADRRYLPDGSLMPRSSAEAVYTDAAQILQQARQLATSGCVDTSAGPLPLCADSLCVHGDNAASVAVAQSIHQLLHA